jgi:hypothetical protein
MSDGCEENSGVRPIRGSSIIETMVDEDVLLYNPAVHRAFRLNEAAAVIWHRCDGRTTVQEIVQGDQAAWELLAQLGADGLVDGVPTTPPTFDMSRRKFVRLGAAVATGTAMLPMMEGLLIPTPAAAQSGTSAGASVNVGVSVGGTSVNSNTTVGGSGVSSNTNVGINPPLPLP